MPKRPPTPPTEATGKYLTVHQPYPPEPNMELTGHRKEVAFWISNCLGNDQDLTAMYHKPKSDKIILEIRDTFKDWRAILGEHRWEEMLKIPTANEKEQCSQIFYCRFTHDREVQKHGWKRIDIPQSWYRDWQLYNGKIVYPYPKSYFCEVPPESPTSAPLCRPLPVEYWPRVLPKVEAQAAAPVPGSVEWAKAKESDAIMSKSASSKGPGAAKAATTKTKTAKSASAAPPGISKPVNSWNNRAGHGSAGLHAPSPVSPIPIRLNTDAYPGAASSASGQSYGTAWASATPVLSPSNISPNARNSSDSGSAGTTPRTPDSSAPLAAGMSSVSISGAPSSAEHSGDEDDVWADGQFPQAAGVSEYAISEPIEAQESLWGGYDEEEDAKKKPDEIICEVHGILCSKGICSQFKSQKRAMERAQELEERSKTKKKGRTKSDSDWRKGNARPDKVKCPTEPRVQRSKPPHLMNPQPSGGLPPMRQTSQGVSPSSVNPGSTNTATRQKPAHLATPDTSSPAEASTPRPARGRRMNTNPSTNTNNVDLSANDSTAPPITAAAPASSGWGYVPRDMYGGSIGAPSVQNEAKGWGYVGRDMYGDSVGAPSVHSQAMDGDDDTKSVAASSTGGWGHPSEGPWGPIKAPNNAGSGSAGGKGKGGKGKNKGKGKSPAWQTTGKVGEKGPQKASWADQVDQADASPDAGLLPSDAPWS